MTEARLPLVQGRTGFESASLEAGYRSSDYDLGFATDTWKVFQLAVVEGVPIEEVAEQLGKSIGAAYAARGRVMKRLKQAIQRLEMRMVK